MAGIPTLGIRTSIATLYEQYFYTRGRLARHKLTRPLVVELDNLRPELDAARDLELKLLAAEYDVSAAVQFIDDDLDETVDKVSSAVLLDTRNDRSAPLYLRYFGALRPSELKRPVLGNQLDTMRLWPPSLKESQNPTLRQLGATLEKQIIEADAVIIEQNRVRQELADFRTVGARAKLVERFNAVRKDIYGRLGKLQHDNPQLGSGWAESFFQVGRESERVTLRALDERVAVAESQLAALRAQRDEMAAQMQGVEEARAAAERAAKQAELAAARRAAEELAARMAELESELGDTAAKKK